MNPWMVETDPIILRRIGKTGEECAELSKICCRILIQGIDGIDPHTHKTNKQSLLEELADVMAQCHVTINSLNLDQTVIDERIMKKMKQMDEWESLVKDKK